MSSKLSAKISPIVGKVGYVLIVLFSIIIWLAVLGDIVYYLLYKHPPK